MRKEKGGGCIRNPTCLSMPSRNHRPDFVSTTHFLTAFYRHESPEIMYWWLGLLLNFKYINPCYDFCDNPPQRYGVETHPNPCTERSGAGVPGHAELRCLGRPHGVYPPECGRLGCSWFGAIRNNSALGLHRSVGHPPRPGISVQHRCVWCVHGGAKWDLFAFHLHFSHYS